MKWSNFTFSDSQKLIKKLDLERAPGRGHDEVYHFCIDGQMALRVVMPNEHGGSGSISRGFILAIRRNLMLETREFEALVDCNLSAKQFETKIRGKLGM